MKIKNAGWMVPNFLAMSLYDSCLTVGPSHQTLDGQLLITYHCYHYVAKFDERGKILTFYY